MTILEAMADPRLFGPWFLAPSWRRWMVFLGAVHGLPREQLRPWGVSPDQALDWFHHHTGRQTWPTQPCGQPVVIKGRRAGYSRVLTTDAVYRSTVPMHSLSPGEKGVFMLAGADLRQAKILHGYAATCIRETPLLARMLVRETSDCLELSNRVTIEARPASFKTVRGVTLIGGVIDELAFMGTDDAALSDAELLTALKPALATTGGALTCGSSPFGKRGELWRLSKFFGREDMPHVLVWRCTSREMNPTLPESLVLQALAEDEPAARAEWLGQFRDDVTNLLDREVVEALVDPVEVRGPEPRRTYVAHVDPSGGRADSMTLAIGHRDGDRVLLDYLAERRPPFDPQEVCGDFATALRRYGLRWTQTDAYGAEWVVSGFAREGIGVRQATRTTSEAFLELLPLVVGGRIRLVESSRLVTQLSNLERRVTRGGREQCGHPSGQHDDLAAAVAGMAAQLAHAPSGGVAWATCDWLS